MILECRKRSKFLLQKPREGYLLDRRAPYNFDMTILVWNVRGMNKMERRQDIKEQIYKLKPSMIGLVETKVRPHKATKVI